MRSVCGVVVGAAAIACFAQQGGHAPAGPPPAWMNKSLSPDERAALVLKEMTLDEKISILHGGPRGRAAAATGMETNGGAGWVLGVPRLGIPPIEMSDAAYGVRQSAQNGRYSTALPSDVGAAASWDVQAACEYGTLIGKELRAQGYNMTLGGGVNLAREPRNGRTFEYMGEDPVLAGTMVGNRIKCEQGQHIIGDIKHFAFNDQESGRTEVDSRMTQKAMHESDLLAFEIGIGIGKPAAVMCSYNAIIDEYACEKKYTLTTVLRDQWKFPGFVVSDWGGAHSTIKASHAGLDIEEPDEKYYGAALKDAVTSGKISQEELDQHVLRVLRSEFYAGIIDYPIQKSVVDVEAGFETARKLEEQSLVLLQNKNAILPLNAAKIKSIAVIGKNADTGMISGGGSAQVDPPGVTAPRWQQVVWFPDSPLKSIAAKAPGVKVAFASNEDVAAAAALAKQSDVAIVFAYQWETEGMDLKDLSLPDKQDDLIAAVAAANPHTIVVLETGTVVTMPWVDKVGGIIESWFSGSKGSDAIANVLFGDVNPSGKTPITFPKSETDLAMPQMVLPPPNSRVRATQTAADREVLAMPDFSVQYIAGEKVGYKWYDSEKKAVLFPFGFGLSYTTYAYSDLQVTGGSAPSASFTVKNTGARAGAEIAEVYASLPAAANDVPKRLVGFTKVWLKPGESQKVTVIVDPKYLCVWSGDATGWQLTPGKYTVMAGGSSQSLPLKKDIDLK